MANQLYFIQNSDSIPEPFLNLTYSWLTYNDLIFKLNEF